MNKNEVAGKTQQAKGAAKRKVGKFIGNEDLEASGAADQVKGKVREVVGTVQRKIKEVDDAADDDINRTH